ncbi:MAG: AbrB/MazE/SpoVT family DNA-binding domain-containing protein [Candidatus Helarchaeota archaeon]
MVTRKIQSTASGSFFVTLPKDWIQDFKLNKGDEIIISSGEDGKLRLSPLTEQKKYYYEFVIRPEDQRTIKIIFPWNVVFKARISKGRMLL